MPQFLENNFKTHSNKYGVLLHRLKIPQLDKNHTVIHQTGSLVSAGMTQSILTRYWSDVPGIESRWG